MFCIKCGNNLPDGTKFCPKCGAIQKSLSNKDINSLPNSQGGLNGHQHQQSSDEKIDFREMIHESWFMWVSLILFPPVGILLCYINKEKHPRWRLICGCFAIIFVVLSISMFFHPKNNTEQVPTAKTETQTTYNENKPASAGNNVVNMNENTDTHLPQGTVVVLEGIVEAGNGKKANRTFATGFGTANSQAIIFTINNVDIKVFLAHPSDTSLFEKKLKIRGKIDNEIKDPIGKKIKENDIVISDAVIID